MSFTATWTFEAQGNKTKVTLRSVFPTAENRDHIVKEYNAIEGGKQTLGRLAEHLRKKPAFELVMEKIIAAPRARVFKAWSDPEQLKHWFAPKPYTLSIKKMDFRPGGSFRMAMQAPSGEKHFFMGTYREVVSPVKIIWTGEFLNGPAEQMRTEITFEENGQKTKIKVWQTFLVLTPETELHTRGAEQGWTMTLDQLAELSRINLLSWNARLMRRFKKFGKPSSTKAK